ncbi:hypothetical protein GGR42_003123 [Saonia flava]|uniref:Secretion system C-terminal sorting domain-containing protein n=1 Tax=Saonia flava TaxID=523696 RepID=A0A846R101_9FLAO|nr:thrombospondin type 3 repeat-containing protein [Saonia flava]NJB72632.1 hypothetical protein [Saonia flava]
MLNFKNNLIPCVTFFFIFSIHFINSQELNWAFSNGGHLTELAWDVQKVPDGIVFLSSEGLEKRNESGEQLWKFDFFELDEYRYSGKPALGAITVDESGNIYAQLTFPSKEVGYTTISNIDIPHGDSLIKISAVGKMLWARNLTGARNTHLLYDNGHIYAIGEFNDTINIDNNYIFENTENTECNINDAENIFARDIYIAKFNTIGQIKDAIVFGGMASEDLRAVSKDKKGNIFLTVNYGVGSCTVDETQIHKLTPELKTVWSKTISRSYEEGNGPAILVPSNLFVGSNDKLYVWVYASNTVISNDFRFIKNRQYGYTGGLIEYNSLSGSFLNYHSFDGLSINGRSGFMVDYKSHLLIATTFRDSLEFENKTLNALGMGEEPVMLTVDLNSFHFNYIMHLTGVPQPYHTSVKDWSGPIVTKGDDLYYSGSFSSDTLHLAPNVSLYNNSGNNDQDYFLAKFNLKSLDFSQAELDDDGDGVSNALDLCPNTIVGVEVNSSGCSIVERDSDNDGVMDDLDICPNTAIGYQVDENGCSETQIDTDGDGVPDIHDNCPSTPQGRQVNEEGCEVVILDPNLFEIETVSEACRGSSNGKVKINVRDSTREYKAILSDGEEIVFVGETEFEDLKAGQYEICLFAHEVDSDMLCYNLSIEEGEEVSLSGKVNYSARTLKIELSGGDVYSVNYNGNVFETNSTALELDLREGINEAYVSTKDSCKGVASFKVFMGSHLQVAPNPFKNQINLSHLMVDEPLDVSIYNQTGQKIYSKKYNPKDELVLRNLTDIPAGIYLLELSWGNTRHSQKLIKK